MVVGRTILAGVATSRLANPVRASIATIKVMVATGVGTGLPLVAASAVLFALSDGLLGHDRLVEPRPRLRVLVLVAGFSPAEPEPPTIRRSQLREFSW